MMYVDTKTECRLWACFRPRKICVHNFPYIPETLRLGKLYHIFRREMQPIKQWKHKQDYILICGSSTVYIIVKLCLMFNSLFSFIRLKDFFRKPWTSTLCTNVLSYTSCAVQKKFWPSWLSFQPITENQRSWNYRAFFQIGRSSECRTKVHSCVHQIYSLHVWKSRFPTNMLCNFLVSAAVLLTIENKCVIKARAIKSVQS